MFESKLDLTELRKLYSFTSNDIYGPSSKESIKGIPQEAHETSQLKGTSKGSCKHKFCVEYQENLRYYEELESAILEEIKEKCSPMVLFVKAALCISQILGDNHVFSDQVCKELQNVYGENFLDM